MVMRGYHSEPTLVGVVEALSSTERGFSFIGDGEHRSISFAELRLRSLRRASQFAERGFRKGQRVAMVVPDGADFAELFLGAICAGLVPVPLYPPFLLAQLDEYLRGVSSVLRVSQAAALVSTRELAGFFEQLPSAVRFIELEEGDGGNVEDGYDPPAVHPEDTAFLQFTSGSTGAPKGVIVTHRSLLANSHAIARHLEVDGSRDRAVTWLPSYHDMGLVGCMLTPLVAEMPMWFIPPLDFARRPPVWCEAIHAVRATHSVAPNFAYRLVTRRVTDEQVGRWDLSSWRFAGCGAEPIQPETLRRFAERLAPAGFNAKAFVAMYGLAEATVAVTGTPMARSVTVMRIRSDTLRSDGRVNTPPPGADAQELVSSGWPLDGLEIGVRGPGGEILGEDREGEIVVRGSSVAAGYFGDDAATAATFRDGWLYTGDLGFVHGGELFVTGRMKDLIIIRGRNYHPQDLESSLWNVPGIRGGNVAAFGVRDGDAEEERLVIVAEGRPGADLDAVPADAVAHIRSRFGLSPDEVVVIERDSLPKTTSGKLRRRETRDRYLAESLPVVARLRKPEHPSAQHVPARG